jgi:hypothetical protein
MHGLLRFCLVVVLVVGCAGSHPGASADSQPTSPAAATEDGGDLAQTAGAETGDAAGVVFQARVPPKGSARVDETEQHSRLEFSRRDGGSTESLVQELQTHSKMRTTVLAVNGEAVVKKRVEYLEGKSEQRIGDRKQGIPNPLIGKTYVLERSDGRFTATRKGGQPVSDYERERLLQDHPNLGQPSPFAALIPRRPIRVGEQLSPDPRVLAAAFGKRDVEVNRAAFTLAAVREREGTRLGAFDVSLTIVETTEQTINQTELEGMVVLQAATCWPEEIDLEGRVSVAGKPPNEAELRGSGTVKIQVRSTYE